MGNKRVFVNKFPCQVIFLLHNTFGDFNLSHEVKVILYMHVHYMHSFHWLLPWIRS